MLTLMLLLLLTGVVLSVLLAAWTIWYQGYIYSQPVEQIYWRAPAAGGAVMLYMMFWVFLNYAFPGSFRIFTEHSANRTTDYLPELKAVYQGKEATYKKVVTGPGRVEYRNGEQKLLTPLEKITIVEDEKESIFEPDRDEKGNVKKDLGASYLIYRDKQGRTMMNVGQITTTQGGSVVANLIVNLLYIGVWFVVLWVVLNFQSAHALIQACVISVVMLLFVMAPFLTRAERLGEETAKAKAAAKASTAK